MKYFISGGTGTLGRELTRQLLAKPTTARIVIFSRDEFKQSEMRKEFPEYPRNIVRYMIGDVRDQKRVSQAMQGCEYVLHTAALKQVPSCEYNPQEAIETNVIGTRNVLAACNAAGIKRCIVVSTDKACQPVNLYGATKLCAEKTAIASNNLGKCRFSVVRYGNVIGSRGSVIPLWKKQAEESGEITLTDENMTRFWITISDAAAFILDRMETMEGGEIFVPKMDSSSMAALARSVVPKDTKIRVVGIRPGEKLHECLIGEADARDCWDAGDGYTIYPEHHEWASGFDKRGVPMSTAFRYTSKKGAV